MHALAKGVVTVLGGAQTRPNVHIDDLVDAYLFSFERRLAGVYNVGFENLRVLDIAEAVGPRHLIVCLLLLNGLRVSEGCSADIDELRGRYVAAPNKSPIRRFRSYVAHELVDCKSCRLRTQCLGCSLCVNRPSSSVPSGARV